MTCAALVLDRQRRYVLAKDDIGLPVVVRNIRRCQKRPGEDGLCGTHRHFNATGTRQIVWPKKIYLKGLTSEVHSS